MREYLDIVNENNKIIGKADREEIHSKKLIHRTAFILVFNSKNEMYIKKRSLKKDLYPGFWEISASGHINAGENIHKAAERELKEELGIKAKLKRIIKFKSFNKVEKEIAAVFICRYDGRIRLNKNEATTGKFCPLEKIISDVKNKRMKFAPNSIIALKKLLSKFPASSPPKSA